MTESEIIEYIIKDIESLGYETIVLPLDRPYTNGKRKIVTYPLPITPFKMAHEFIHAKYKDMCRKSPCDTTSPHEKRANKEAILFLWDIFISEGGSFELFQKFIEISGCPCDTSFSLLCKVNEEVIKELNHKDSHEKDFSKMSLKECVIDYISHFDVVEQINTYQFLEAYNLPYENYDKAVELFKNMLKLDYAI